MRVSARLRSAGEMFSGWITPGQPLAARAKAHRSHSASESAVAARALPNSPRAKIKRQT